MTGTNDVLTGGGIVLSATALLKLAEMAFNAWRARNQRTEIAPNPLAVEQTAFQAHCKDNDHELSNIFDRLRKVESEVAGHGQAILAMKDMQNKIYDMVQALYDRIITSKRK